MYEINAVLVDVELLRNFDLKNFLKVENRLKQHLTFGVFSEKKDLSKFVNNLVITSFHYE